MKLNFQTKQMLSCCCFFFCYHRRMEVFFVNGCPLLSFFWIGFSRFVQEIKNFAALTPLRFFRALLSLVFFLYPRCDEIKETLCHSVHCLFWDVSSGCCLALSLPLFTLFLQLLDDGRLALLLLFSFWFLSLYFTQARTQV